MCLRTNLNDADIQPALNHLPLNSPGGVINHLMALGWQLDQSISVLVFQNMAFLDKLYAYCTCTAFNDNGDVFFKGEDREAFEGFIILMRSGARFPPLGMYNAQDWLNGLARQGHPNQTLEGISLQDRIVYLRQVSVLDFQLSLNIAFENRNYDVCRALIQAAQELMPIAI